VTFAKGGGDPDGYSSSPAISADGQWVAFGSVATNLIDGDTNGARDVFLWERATELITRVSIGPGGLEADDDSAGWGCAISGDGNRIAFDSRATNLVAGGTDGTLNVYVHDRTTNQTILASVAADGGLANGPSVYAAISADGRCVAFVSDATNLVEGDTNGVRDVFVRDLLLQVTKRVSIASDGTQATNLSRFRPALSADGRYVAFSSAASNLVPEKSKKRLPFNIYVHDQFGGSTELVSVAMDGMAATKGMSWYPAISADGRFVAFDSAANNLVPEDTSNLGRDAFVHDRDTGLTTLVSVASDGTQGDYVSGYPAISADGRFVAFESSASNLVPDDTNDAGDIFVHDLTGPPPATGAVAGTVTDASDGSPIAGAMVSADTGQSAITAGDGSYSIPDVPVGDRSVAASADGYESAQQTVPVAENATSTADFTLEAVPEPISCSVASIGYKTTGPKGKDLLITVTVIDNFLEPVAGASVAIDVSLNGDSYANPADVTGEDGTVTFKLRNAPAGTYSTVVTAVTAGDLIWDGLTPANSFSK
jgi:Tol biopolymer transport system component